MDGIRADQHEQHAADGFKDAVDPLDQDRHLKKAVQSPVFLSIAHLQIHTFRANDSPSEALLQWIDCVVLSVQDDESYGSGIKSFFCLARKC